MRRVMHLPDRSGFPRWARIATSPWLLSPLLVFALLIGAFLGYGAYTRSKPTHYARGGDEFPAGSLPSTVPSAAPSVRPSAVPSPGQRGARTPTLVNNGTTTRQRRQTQPATRPTKLPGSSNV